MAKKLIVLSTAPEENKTIQDFLSAAKDENVETELINPDNCYFLLGKDNEAFISHEGKKFEGADFCITRSNDTNLEYKVAIMDHLEKMGVKMLNTGSSIRKCANKILTQILLTKNNFKTPKTIVITNIDQLGYAMKTLDEKFPVIVKTLFGTQGIGVIRADSMPSLKSIVQQLIETQTEFMIQEYIDHKESARAYVLGDEVIVGIMRTIPEHDFRSNAHQGAKIKKHEMSKIEIELCLKANELLGTHFSAVDYIIDGDDIIMLEVNGSPGFEILQKTLDENIPEKIVKWMVHNKSDLVTPANQDPKDEDDAQEIENSVEDNEHEDREDSSKPEITPVSDTKSDSKSLGSISEVIIKYINNEKPILARIDTGAAHSSLHAEDIEVRDEYVKFRFEDYIYKFPTHRFLQVKTTDMDKDTEKRPVIKVDMIIDGKDIKDVELTLKDRSNMKFQALIGRSTLIAGEFTIDLSKDDGKDNLDPETKELVSTKSLSSSDTNNDNENHKDEPEYDNNSSDVDNDQEKKKDDEE